MLRVVTTPQFSLSLQCVSDCMGETSITIKDIRVRYVFTVFGHVILEYTVSENMLLQKFSTVLFYVILNFLISRN